MEWHVMTNSKWNNAHGDMAVIKAQWEAVWHRALGEMATWAQEYGSRQLRMAIKHGYQPQKLYWWERLQREWPGWGRFEDHDVNHWGILECPSEDTLQAEEEVMRRMEAADYPMAAETRRTDNGREMIIVQTYLGAWDICRITHIYRRDS